MNKLSLAFLAIKRYTFLRGKVIILSVTRQNSILHNLNLASQWLLLVAKGVSSLS